jgi:hypothetical protein
MAEEMKEDVKDVTTEQEAQETVAEKKPVKEEKENVITLKKPYKFEGKEYTEIDLSGLEKMTVMDAVDVQIELFNQREVATATVCESTTAFARAIAAKATGLPIEFFQLAPRSVSKQVTRAIRGFLNIDANTENHVMRLEKPYCFKGETYTEVDLNGIADLNSMNESAAENKMARMGIVITENSFNYYYACVIASMATEQPEEFFTGLPLREVLKLKTAVNSADFFE